MSHAEQQAIIDRNEKIERLIEEKLALVRQRDECRKLVAEYDALFGKLPRLKDHPKELIG
jgi:hypothetical protein